MKADSWIIQIENPWCSPFCTRWPSAMQNLEWKNMQSALQKELHFRQVVVFWRKQRIRIWDLIYNRFRFTSHRELQHFCNCYIFISATVIITEGQAFLPLCHPNSAHSTCWWKIFLEALLSLIEQQPWTTVLVQKGNNHLNTYTIRCWISIESQLNMIIKDQAL